ncbi:MAG: ferrous iron transport protein A [Candidatus Thiothrix sulfatifontis]|nr:MAG: ferrous iron transport protein A [Candidatus Thiothrix sulfatifontis]
MSLADARPLSTLTESSSAHIYVIQTDNATRIRLLGMGIGKGSRIDILRNRNGDIVLGNGNNRISLGRTITDHIMVHVQE